VLIQAAPLQRFTQAVAVPREAQQRKTACVHANSLVAGILTCSGHGSKDVVALGGHLGGAIGVVACVVVGERHELLAHPSESSALLYG